MNKEKFNLQPNEDHPISVNIKEDVVANRPSNRDLSLDSFIDYKTHRKNFTIFNRVVAMNNARKKTNVASVFFIVQNFFKRLSLSEVIFGCLRNARLKF